jgi:hypothetical protein
VVLILLSLGTRRARHARASDTPERGGEANTACAWRRRRGAAASPSGKSMQTSTITA